MSFLLSLKVNFPPDQSLAFDGDSTIEFPLEGRCVLLKKATNGMRAVVRGFETEADAQAFANRLAIGLRVWAAQRCVSATVVQVLSKPYMYDDFKIDPTAPGNPMAKMLFKAGEAGEVVRIDGMIDDSDSVIYEEARMIIAGGGSATGNVGHHPGYLISDVEEALARGADQIVLDDPKLDLVLDLAIAAHKERSPRARLFGLVSALEAMVDDELRGEHVQRAVAAAIGTVEDLVPSDPTHAAELKGLSGDMGRLRYASVSSRLKKLLAAGLPEASEYGDCQRVTKLVMDAQGAIRSKLIHGHAHPETLDLNSHNRVLAWAIVQLIRYRLGLPPALPPPPAVEQ